MAIEIIEKVRESEKSFDNVVLTVGSFDGVHLGHQCIIEDVVAKAKAIGGTPAVLTMHPHPREFFAPDNAPNILTNPHKQAALLDALGIQVLYVLQFNEETANMEPEEFVEEILLHRCHAVSVIVGHDCRFGKAARGDVSFLRKAGLEHHFEVKEIQPVILEAERISSTLIRERVLQGDLPTVEKLLGRKYSITGTVLSGRGMGAKLGFPTANIKPNHSAVPAQGVYIAEALLNGTAYPAAVNVGIAPTIRHDDLTIEAHILDFHGDITGDEIEIVFHQRVRTEKKFPNLQALTDQITLDVQTVRDYFHV